MLASLQHWEPLWLLIILTIEMAAGLYSAWILRVEYHYDKEWNERKAARRRRHLDFESLTAGEGK